MAPRMVTRRIHLASRVMRPPAEVETKCGNPVGVDHFHRPAPGAGYRGWPPEAPVVRFARPNLGRDGSALAPPRPSLGLRGRPGSTGVGSSRGDEDRPSPTPGLQHIWWAYGQKRRGLNAVVTTWRSSIRQRFWRTNANPDCHRECPKGPRQGVWIGVFRKRLT